MIIATLKRTGADKYVAHFCQVVCSISGGLVLVPGIRRPAELDLTGAELYTAMTATLVLSDFFIVPGFQCRAWRRAAQQSICTWR